jgi:hypothetical protein
MTRGGVRRVARAQQIDQARSSRLKAFRFLQANSRRSVDCPPVRNSANSNSCIESETIQNEIKEITRSRLLLEYFFRITIL